MPRIRTQLNAAGERLAARLAGPRPASGVDLVVAAALTEHGVSGLNDPAAYVDFLRSCWQPDPVEVTAHQGGGSALFAALLDHLASGMAPIPVDDAVRIGRISDRLLSDRTPFDRPGSAVDVGVHAAVSSSFGHSGRLLTAVVRFMRSRTCLEIGTAYGLSALFLAAALDRGHEPGSLTTVECSEPQASLAFELLKEQHPGSVRTIRGRSTEALPEVAADGQVFDLLFHDGEHSAAAYVADFTAYEPHLAPGSVVLFDDITWGDPAQGSDTLAGWTTLTRHERVAQSVVLDGWYGLLLLH